MTNMEKRGGHLGVEVRAVADKKTLAGYAVVWNSETIIAESFIEVFRPGAFDRALRGDVLALHSHDSGRVLGRTSSGTLRLKDDGRGLSVEIDVPDTSDGMDVWTLVGRRDISGMSFAFRATKEEWDDTGDLPKRTVIEADLYEVSACSMPAYPDTTLGLRSLEHARVDAELRRMIEQRKAENAAAARRRVAEREARQEQKIRGIRQDAS